MHIVNKTYIFFYSLFPLITICRASSIEDYYELQYNLTIKENTGNGYKEVSISTYPNHILYDESKKVVIYDYPGRKKAVCDFDAYFGLKYPELTRKRMEHDTLFELYNRVTKNEDKKKVYQIIKNEFYDYELKVLKSNESKPIIIKSKIVANFFKAHKDDSNLKKHTVYKLQMQKLSDRLSKIFGEAEVYTIIEPDIIRYLGHFVEIQK